ncbi:MAG: hypothetical protein PHO32_01600 [Candidatus Cloacimonetes bacterium]|nr:hypothetical protein [Candidatus Cloacimonadota bacterium]
MSTIFIDKHIKNQFDKLPSGWAFFALKGAQEFLYSGCTANLSRKLKFLQDKAEEGGLYKDMWKEAESLSWTSYPQGIDALVKSKVFALENAPLYQHRLMPWANYAYLALSAANYPFITVTEQTNEEWLYVGPFRSRFFLADVIDTFSRILKLPYCETSNYPCEKFDRDICRGWCLSLAPAKESVNEHSLKKLDALLKEAYIHPENGILEMVQKERDNYFNELEFEKADLLDDEIDLLANYRDWLNFLFVAKKLEFESDTLVVQEGRIIMCKHENREYHFPISNTDFRDNETLALNLDTVDECRIIYDYLTKTSKSLAAGAVS